MNEFLLKKRFHFHFAENFPVSTGHRTAQDDADEEHERSLNKKNRVFAYAYVHHRSGGFDSLPRHRRSPTAITAKPVAPD